MSFWANLEAALALAGKSKADLARHLNISSQAISAYRVPGKLPNTTNLEAMARYLGVTVDFLLRGESKPPTDAPAGAFARFLPSRSPDGPLVPGGPKRGEPLEDPDELSLVGFWRSLEATQKRAMVDILVAAGRLQLGV